MKTELLRVAQLTSVSFGEVPQRNGHTRIHYLKGKKKSNYIYLILVEEALNLFLKLLDKIASICVKDAAVN